MSRLQILLSCMHEQGAAIAERMNIRCDAVIVNQCDADAETVVQGNSGGTLLCIDSSERGLSRSRNMAMARAQGELCLLADDDETFADDVADIVARAFDEHPEAAILLFNVGNSSATRYRRARRVGYRGAMRTSSSSIAFRRNSVLKEGIRFDVEMGSGTGHGACEETKFLFDSMRRGLTVVGVPYIIATKTLHSASKWFEGYTRDYFLQRGWATQRFMGPFFATLYAFYTAARQYPKYRRTLSPLVALTAFLKGVYSPNMYAKDAE